MSALTFDTLTSTIANIPAASSATLACDITLLDNQGSGYGTSWVVTLPSASQVGFVKRFSCPASGSTGAVSTELSGQFAGGYTKCRLAGGSQPTSVGFVWTGTAWAELCAESVTYS